MDEDLVFKALADPTRRRLLDALHERSGLTLGELCEGVAMRRQSATQHLELLEAANLVTSARDGRRKLHYLNPVPIHEIQSRWIWKFEERHLAALEAIKNKAEEQPMTTSIPGQTTVPDYVYTTYIRATPEEIWEALTDPALTARFWGHAQVSTWQLGSRVEHKRTDDSGISDAVGTVVVVDRPRRLAFTFDDPALTDDPTFEPSTVTFEIEPGDGIVKLTLTHSGLRTNENRDAIGQGWPAVLANLKTLIETGEALPQAPWEVHAEQREKQTAKNG